MILERYIRYVPQEAIPNPLISTSHQISPYIFMGSFSVIDLFAIYGGHRHVGCATKYPGCGREVGSASTVSSFIGLGMKCSFNQFQLCTQPQYFP